jgi:four helix bundle protein
MPRRYDLEGRLLGFAVQACRIVERLPPTVIGRHVGTQLVRSVTSPPANYAEAQGAESRRDFVHRLRICLKELRETRTWLKFVSRMELLPAGTAVDAAVAEADELIAILVTSIRTAGRRANVQ